MCNVLLVMRRTIAFTSCNVFSHISRRALSTNIIQIYKDCVNSKIITADPMQLKAVKYLQALNRTILRATKTPSQSTSSDVESTDQNLTNSKLNTDLQNCSGVSESSSSSISAVKIKGMYIYGPIGTGNAYSVFKLQYQGHYNDLCLL